MMAYGLYFIKKYGYIIWLYMPINYDLFNLMGPVPPQYFNLYSSSLPFCLLLHLNLAVCIQFPTLYFTYLFYSILLEIVSIRSSLNLRPESINCIKFLLLYFLLKYFGTQDLKLRLEPQSEHGIYIFSNKL